MLPYSVYQIMKSFQQLHVAIFQAKTSSLSFLREVAHRKTQLCSQTLKGLHYTLYLAWLNRNQLKQALNNSNIVTQMLLQPKMCCQIYYALRPTYSNGVWRATSRP